MANTNAGDGRVGYTHSALMRCFGGIDKGVNDGTYAVLPFFIGGLIYIDPAKIDNGVATAQTLGLLAKGLRVVALHVLKAGTAASTAQIGVAALGGNGAVDFATALPLDAIGRTASLSMLANPITRQLFIDITGGNSADSPEIALEVVPDIKYWE